MSTTPNPPDPDLEKLMATEAPPSRGRRLRRLLVWGLVALLLLFGLFSWWGMRDGDAQIDYRTVAARRGDLRVTVTATGNLQPTNQVEVGSEVSGTIAAVSVDYNDQVEAGQVLARLDTTKLEAQASQARAALAFSRANLQQARVGLDEAARELARLVHLRQLSAGKLPSAQDLETAEMAVARARANEAMIRANIAEATARLEVDETNLEKAVIVSPINGVVLVRSVEPGQTVAASLQAPVLFTLAEDLTKMELHVDVDEADVGQVREGQQAIFTVDAYPDRTFPARITQVRYGAQSVAGVVSYLTVLDVDNSDLSLRPGMTATADIVTQEVKDALLVPNAALRYRPPEPEMTEKQAAGGSLLSKLFPRPSRTMSKKATDSGDRSRQQLWVLRENQPQAVSVTIGATDGIMTEILAGEVSEGMTFISEAVRTGK